MAWCVRLQALLPENLQSAPRVVSEHTPASLPLIAASPPSADDSDRSESAALDLPVNTAVAVKREAETAFVTPPPPKVASRKRAKPVVPKLKFDTEMAATADVSAAVLSTPVKSKSAAGGKRKGLQGGEAPETPPVLEGPAHSRAHSAAEIVKLRLRVGRNAFEE